MSSSKYRSHVPDQRPDLDRDDDNLFEVVRWTRHPDFKRVRDSRDLNVDWTTADRGGRRVARRAVANSEGTVMAVCYYALSRGGEYVGHEWYDAGQVSGTVS